MRVYTIKDDRIVYLGEYELVPFPELGEIAAIKGSIIAYVKNSDYVSFIGALKDTKELELIESLAYELQPEYRQDTDTHTILLFTHDSLWDAWFNLVSILTYISFDIEDVANLIYGFGKTSIIEKLIGK